MTFKEMLTDLYQRITSRTFLILAASVVLLIKNDLTTEEFLAINGASYGGTALKDIVAKVIIALTPAVQKQLDDKTKEVQK